MENEMKPSYDGHEEWAGIPPPTFHAIRDLDGKHCDGHNRLRIDFDQMAERMSLMERSLTEHSSALTNVEKRTTDVGSLRWSTPTVGALIGVCAVVVGAVYGMTSGVKDLQAVQTTELTAIRTMIVAKEKLDDERADQVKEAIKRIDARGEMTAMQLSNFRETMTNRK